MPTAKDLIKKAFRHTMKLDAGGELDPALQAEGFALLVDLINSWTGLLVPHWTWDSFSLVVGQASYTIGTNGSPDVNDVRPEQIEEGFVRDSSNFDHTDFRMVGEDEYRRISDKTSLGRPFIGWYNPTEPKGTLYLYYTPSATDTLFYSHRKPITVPTKASSDMSVPPNYEAALIWNLALEISPMVGREPSLVVLRRASETKRALINLNAARNRRRPKLEITRTREVYQHGDNIG